MDIQSQCCTEQQARRLKELGVEQCSYFRFWDNNGHVFVDNYNVDADHPHLTEVASAFTVAELGVMLPVQLEIDKELHVWHSFPEIDDCFICALVGYSKKVLVKIEGSNESDVRADMLIYLIENNYNTVEEVNQRLQNS